LKDRQITNLSGVFWGYVITILLPVFSSIMGATMGLSVAVGIVSSCNGFSRRKYPHLDSYQETFISCSTFFAANFSLTRAVIGLVAGTVLGYVSEVGGLMMANKEVN